MKLNRKETETRFGRTLSDGEFKYIEAFFVGLGYTEKDKEAFFKNMRTDRLEDFFRRNKELLNELTYSDSDNDTQAQAVEFATSLPK